MGENYLFWCKLRIFGTDDVDFIILVRSQVWPRVNINNVVCVGYQESKQMCTIYINKRSRYPDTSYIGLEEFQYRSGSP